MGSNTGWGFGGWAFSSGWRLCEGVIGDIGVFELEEAAEQDVMPWMTTKMSDKKFKPHSFGLLGTGPVNFDETWGYVLSDHRIYINKKVYLYRFILTLLTLLWSLPVPLIILVIILFLQSVGIFPSIYTSKHGIRVPQWSVDWAGWKSVQGST